MVSPNFPEEMLPQLRSFITERTGLYFRDHTLYNLHAAVTKRMAVCGTSSASEYYDLLRNSPRREEEFRELFFLLTTNHTYFFRNEAQFRVFKERLLLALAQRKRAQAVATATRPRLRIWSAGCATGEEPYTLAIILRECIGDLKDWDVEILATDASMESLRLAREGLFKGSSLQQVPEELKKKYFELREGPDKRLFYAVASAVKDLVRFDFFNLMSEQYPQEFDVIFCRNVVMYFEQASVRRVMEKIHASLCDDGLLFIGYSESLQFMKGYFDMVYEDEAIYYRRRVPLPDSREDGPAVIATFSKEEEIAPEVENVKTAIKIRDYARAQRLLDDMIAADPRQDEPYFLSAEILLAKGETFAAKEKLRALLKREPLSPRAHYLMGRACLEENVTEEAKRNFKKAVYLDSACVMACFFLAQVYKMENQKTKAMREYRNILKLLLSKSLSDEVPLSGGIDVATLLSVCHENLERLKKNI